MYADFLHEARKEKTYPTPARFATHIDTTFTDFTFDLT
jgi:hypothetical protein